MEIFRSYSIFLVLALIIFSMTKCANPYCPKKDNPRPPNPMPTSSEITSWTDKSTALISANLIGDFFTDELTGYVVGHGGVIYKTIDGFTSFTTLNSGTSQNLIGVWFTDANTGYVVGNAGTILKTTNAGATWTALPPPTSTNYTHVFFLDANTGYVTGGVGTLLKTTNAGASWTILNPNTSEDLHGIFFTNANTGFISGQVYTMRKTTDAGATWLSVNSDLTGGNVVTPLPSIYFTNDSTGYCVGGYAYPTGTPSNGVILKTTDRGANWFKQAHPAGTDLFCCVKFSSPTTGYIVGGDMANNTSTILKTTDGGTTWTVQPTFNYRLNHVFLTNSGVGYAVGENGALLKGNL
jgi:photosystem II stability/assembly factor-like uncharacterized protein